NHGLPAIPAEEHPQHLIRDEICRELTETAMTVKSNCSANTLSALLVKARSYLHWGQFSEADECLKEMCRLSVAAAAREYRQMDHSRNISAVQSRLHSGFRTYENRGHLETRLDLLESDIMALRGFERVVTTGEKEKLAECYEHIAAHGLKGAILLKRQQQKQEQRQSLTMTMA
ncbi:MAG TPA: hypothetical protein DD738_08845, partial [Ruminiclostridium sp.]|nr:hypothetical protein [Ruminiclostridium sp.]